MFLFMCVTLFMGAWGSLHDVTTCLAAWSPLSSGVSVSGPVFILGGLCPGGLYPEGLHSSVRSPSKGVSFQGMSLSKGVSVQGSLSTGSLSRGL